jgi:hypothetical protein
MATTGAIGTLCSIASRAKPVLPAKSILSDSQVGR